MRRAWRLGGGVALCCAMLAPSAGRAQVPVQGGALKAAYIYNIALFTTWPAAAAAGGGERGERPFAVCARPTHTLWESLRRLEGKPVNGRPWTLLDAASAPRSCDISVMTGETAPSRAPELSAGTLYVVDGAAAGRYAGAVTLVDEDDHVRFDVDTREAARLGLKFSSRLLRLARNVL
ncbi:YfiR family protein [Pseudoduganella namucuonensis]|uniref:DUF4154 domain-containing protein n=1 Tax=Pseudoduganella namucuonensis TaxID=1035707 RepID=A0A1I7GQF3_9BURK|nr:YfiR family protein [Pseudoduganella namucuonensis]SFU50581.1 protein of unknown function [Pseudoduganella namucuonensis]